MTSALVLTITNLTGEFAKADYRFEISIKSVIVANGSVLGFERSRGYPALIAEVLKQITPIEPPKLEEGKG